ncbi:MAG: hypothetical protein ACRD1I_08230, partial [Terriglobia bacterium]
ARLRLRLRVSRPVSLLESCLADVPVVLGHFRPFILVPAGLLAGLPSGQIEARGLFISLSWVQDVVVSEARPHPIGGVDYPRTIQEFEQWFLSERGCESKRPL